MTHLSADTRPRTTGPWSAGVSAVLSRPRVLAFACMAVLTAGGWTYLLLAAGLQGASEPAGFLAAICRGLPVTRATAPGTVAVVAAMWVAMTLAMMLPTAGPMILTYADIAETAWRKGDRIVSPHVLIGGYLAVWFGFAGLATVAQLGAMSLAAWPVIWPGVWPGVSDIAAPASAMLFVVAGLYQFSALKQACLSACQQPFSFFFLNWTDRPRGVFRLGVRQGLYCLGCCWATMLLMLAAGAMNALWMALLGLVMLIEKTTTSPHVSSHVSRAIGIAFTAAGLTIFAAWGSGFVVR